MGDERRRGPILSASKERGYGDVGAVKLRDGYDGYELEGEVAESAEFFSWTILGVALLGLIIMLIYFWEISVLPPLDERGTLPMGPESSVMLKKSSERPFFDERESAIYSA